MSGQRKEDSENPESQESHVESTSTLTGETVQPREHGAHTESSKKVKVVRFPNLTVDETGQREEPDAEAGSSRQANVTPNLKAVDETGQREEPEAKAGSSRQAKMAPNLKVQEWRKKRHVTILQQKYIRAYVQNQMKSCPDTRCNNYQPCWNIVTHLLDAHCYVPRIQIDLETTYTSPIKLYELEYAKSKCIAVLLVPLITVKGKENPNDSSVMPLVVLASKIHPCGNLEYVQSHTETSIFAEPSPMKDGDLLMVWVCGHIDTLTTRLEVYNTDKTHSYIYTGYVHNIANNNHDPRSVFARGNCLLMPAYNVKAMAEFWSLNLDTKLSLRDEDI